MLATTTHEPLALALSIEDIRNYQLVVSYKGHSKTPIKRACK